MVLKIFRRVLGGGGGGGFSWIFSNYWLTLSAGTNYAAISNQNTTSGSEFARQVLTPRAGTLSLFCARVTTNTTNVGDVFRPRVNELNVNQLVTIPATTTGDFQDVVNTDAVIVFDRLNYEVVRTNGAKVLHSMGMMIE